MTKTVVPAKSLPPVWPWEWKQLHSQYREFPARVTQISFFVPLPRIPRACCKWWNRKWAVSTVSLPCGAFGWKDSCGSTVLTVTESDGIKRQTDWQTELASQWFIAWHGRCVRRTGFSSWTRTDEITTAQTALRKKERSKKSTRRSAFRDRGTTCLQPDQRWYCFGENFGETLKSQGWACMRLPERHDATLIGKWKLETDSLSASK